MLFVWGYDTRLLIGIVISLVIIEKYIIKWMKEGEKKCYSRETYLEI